MSKYKFYTRRVAEKGTWKDTVILVLLVAVFICLFYGVEWVIIQLLK